MMTNNKMGDRKALRQNNHRLAVVMGRIIKLSPIRIQSFLGV